LLRAEVLVIGIVAIGIVVHGFDLPMRRDERPVVPSKAKA
jgi:hypothetical protein